jgi:hypothetical protein
LTFRSWNFLSFRQLLQLASLFQTQQWSEFMGWLSRFFEVKDSSKVENPAVAFGKPVDVVNDSNARAT